MLSMGHGEGAAAFVLVISARRRLETSFCAAHCFQGAVVTASGAMGHTFGAYC